MIRTFTAYTDFCYLVRRNVINIDTLDQIDDAVERFVRYRNIFKTTGVREDTPKASAFSLPRQHAMVHYRQHVENFGAPNGLCSSITESKHIVAVKRPYRRTSHYNALKQMLVINERMDKLAAAHQDFKKRGMLQGSCLDEVLRQIAEEEWDTKLLEDVEGEDGEDMDIEEDLDELNLDLPMLDNDVDATATLDQGEGDEEYGPVDGPTLYNEVFLARTKGTSFPLLFESVVYLSTTQLEAIPPRRFGRLVCRSSRRTSPILFAAFCTHRSTPSKTSTQPSLTFDNALRFGTP